eukprot:scaffold310499_cov18-Tisochrysis_lutea.AAC.1
MWTASVKFIRRHGMLSICCNLGRSNVRWHFPVLQQLQPKLDLKVAFIGLSNEPYDQQCEK